MPRSPPEVRDASANGPTLLRAVLGNALAHVLPNASGVADGCTDPDTVHQLRVGLRRWRTVLPAQGALGRHNDLVVAAEKFRADAQKDPNAWFAAGFLQAHQTQRRRGARSALRDADEAQPFWDHERD